MTAAILPDDPGVTDTRPRIARRGDKVHISVNVATLLSLLTGGGGYLYQDMKSAAEARARAVVLEERLIQLQSQAGEMSERCVR